MRCLFLLFVTVTLCAHAAHGVRVAPAAPSVASLWIAHPTAPRTDSDVITFHVYWPLNDERASRAGCHTRGPAGSTAVLQCKMDALGPSAAAVAATKAWLAPAGEACEFSWNAVHCRAVPVARAEALFSMPAGSLQAWCQASTATAATECSASNRFLAAADATATIPTSCAVESVTGLHLYDYTVKTAKHMGQVRPQMDAAAPPAVMPYPYSQYIPNSIGNFALYGTTSPLVLSADGRYITVVPECQYGSFIICGTTSLMCSLSSDNPPTSLTVTYSDTRGNVLHTSRAYALQELNCTSSKSLLRSSTSSAGVWFIPTAPLSTFSSWQQLSINVTTYYASSSQPTATMTDMLSAFWNGFTFTTYNVSPDLKTWFTQRPAISVTMPSPNYNRPSDLNSMYSVPAGATADGQVVGVVEFTYAAIPQGGLSNADIASYVKNLGISSTSTYSVIGNSSIVSSGETTLDLELMLGVATGAHTYVYCLSYGLGGDFNLYSDALEGFASSAFGQDRSKFTKGAATVWSISYGGPEWVHADGTVDPQLTRINTLFKQMTDAGVTVVASTGDSGSYWLGTNQRVAANFPASSPYVVGVGATERRREVDTGFVSEMACNAKQGNYITSGGGYSSAFAPESWQNQSLPLPNRTWAGVPDIAANGAWIYVVLNGQTVPLFGTSASSPIVAAFIAIVNRQMYVNNATHGTLRQATNFLYQLPMGAAFTDITEGDNCAGEHGPSPLSNNYAIYAPTQCYYAGAGWDPVTGLGTPVVQAWLQPAFAWRPAPFAEDEPSHDSNSWVHIGIAAAAVVALFVGALSFCAVRRQRKRQQGRAQYAGSDSVQAAYASMDRPTVVVASQV